MSTTVKPGMQELEGKETNNENNVLKDEEPAENPCPICFEERPTQNDEDFCRTACGHVYHAHCVFTWIANQSLKVHQVGCPLCRQPLNTPFAEADNPWPDRVQEFMNNFRQLEAHIQSIHERERTTWIDIIMVIFFLAVLGFCTHFLVEEGKTIFEIGVLKTHLSHMPFSTMANNLFKNSWNLKDDCTFSSISEYLTWFLLGQPDMKTIIESKTPAVLPAYMPCKLYEYTIGFVLTLELLMVSLIVLPVDLLICGLLYILIPTLIIIVQE